MEVLPLNKVNTIRDISWDHENSEQRSYKSVVDENLQAAFVSNKGGRGENQDCWGFVRAQDGSLVFCVADGLGGHKGGRIAAHTAISSVSDFVQTDQFSFDRPETLFTAFEKANQAIIQKQSEIPDFENMRTTLVVLMIKDSLAYWAHSGDVRLYHFQSEKMIEKTKDQSVPQMLVDLGEISEEEMAHHPERSKLLGSLGGANTKIKPRFLQNYRQIQPNDVFVLSTDGFWEWVSEEELSSICHSSDISSLMESFEKKVLERAEQDSYFDNFSFAVIKLTKAEKNISYWFKTQFKCLGISE